MSACNVIFLQCYGEANPNDLTILGFEQWLWLNSRMAMIFAGMWRQAEIMYLRSCECVLVDLMLLCTFMCERQPDRQVPLTRTLRKRTWNRDDSEVVLYF